MTSPILPPPGEPEPASAWLPAGLADDLAQGFAADATAIDRVRVEVTAEFRQRQGARLEARPRVLQPRPRWSLQTFGALGLAAVMLLGTVGLVAANSGPGDAFYDLRLAAETLNLPFIGGSVSRLDRMQHRLDEARGEAGNAAAVRAALKAYREELQRALDEASTAADRQAVLDALAVHSVVLNELSKDVPPAAGAGIQQAQEQVGKAQEELGGGPTTGPQPAASVDPGSPTHSPAPGENGRPSGR